ncbi:hypothetical protein NP493_517g00014 [Ridgeia piscesae]|uniref:PiggyBac transposable element-derived protein domain-containing protein n=1 Tax=Ridgeia piscesae TaxID=27915 RepID=A0AAD9KWL2_RIDPI|nr:hypothetical protein NP493_517g00014 [Ridgeia piscesae]
MVCDSDSDDGEMEGGSDVEIDDHEPDPPLVSSSDESCDTAELPGPSTYNKELRGRGRGRGHGRDMGRPAHGYPPPAVLGRNFFADMATSTNAYAVVHGGRLWADTTEDEMRFFFGILILMGVNERPQYRDY